MNAKNPQVNREQMNIVIVGHVDHGKSTVIGRLLADTGSLPEGKLQAVKDNCTRNSKEFEYAFLLDALKDEQEQGITIDTARCFFHTAKREYIIIDAPGHIEFLKNMISGAARAEAALLVIDADEGIQENSRRHAYMLSLLGIKQLIVLVNKMDLVEYDQLVFEKVQKNFSKFLEEIDMPAKSFIPVSAREGDNIASTSQNMRWYTGPDVLESLDDFDKEPPLKDKPFRMPVQGVYKFTGTGDQRRILAGRVESGSAAVGDEILFLPSGKKSKIQSIEEYNAEEKKSISAGVSTSITLTEQIYVNRGEIACKVDNAALVGTRLGANLFWMGKEPLNEGDELKLKLGTAETPMTIEKIEQVLNSSNLQGIERKEIKRHEVGEVIINTKKVLAFDTYAQLKSLGRFVIVKNYDIWGGGIITQKLPDEQENLREQVYKRQETWEKGMIGVRERARRYAQKPSVILFTGPTGVDKKTVAKKVEKELFNQGRAPYFLGIGNLLRGLDADVPKSKKEEHLRRLGEVAHILLDAGLLVLMTASDLTSEEVEFLRTIIGDNSVVTVQVGNGELEADLNLEEGRQGNIDNIIKLLSKQHIIIGEDNGF